MNDNLKTNAYGIALIKQFEGFRDKAYLDAACIWTIGYGHTRMVIEGMTVTEEAADDLLESDLEIAELCIKRMVTVPLNINQFSALVSFVFNVGAHNLERSTLLKLLNRGWYDSVTAQILRWNQIHGEISTGLTKRREAERVLWNTPVEVENVS